MGEIDAWMRRAYAGDDFLREPLEDIIWLPFLIVKLLILILRAVSLLVGRAAPLLRNLSYLATVAVTTHTFDNSRFRDKDFPEIKNREEDLVTCFRRIAARREAIMTKRK